MERESCTALTNPNELPFSGSETVVTNLVLNYRNHQLSVLAFRRISVVAQEL